jgi:hypothetical protein
MKRVSVINLLILFASFTFLFPFSASGKGPKSKAVGGPPAHAPAHGYRAKYNYNYYPKENVYFDTSRKLYFYMDGDNWRASVSLPLDLKVRLGDHVNIELDFDKPYIR